MVNDQREFDQALRQWAARPPDTAPAQAAAEVVARIRARRRQRRQRFSWFAAAATVMVMVSTVVWHRLDTAPGQPADHVAQEVTGVDEGVVLMWLDEETPLYMTYQIADAARDEEGLEP